MYPVASTSVTRDDIRLEVKNDYHARDAGSNAWVMDVNSTGVIQLDAPQHFAQSQNEPDVLATSYLAPKMAETSFLDAGHCAEDYEVVAGK